MVVGSTFQDKTRVKLKPTSAGITCEFRRKEIPALARISCFRAFEMMLFGYLEMIQFLAVCGNLSN